MKAVITLEEGKLPMVEFERDGTKRSIHTNFRDILHMIETSYTEDNYDDEIKRHLVRPITISPALPVGTIKYSLNNANEHIIFMQFDEFSSDFNYHTTGFKNIPFPKMIFCFKVKENKVLDRHVMVYKDKFVRDDTELFRFPYANVFSGGGLCYYEDRDIKDLVQLQTFPYRWSTVAMNDHVYYPENTTKNVSLRELLKDSQGKSFNYDILVPTGKTFGSWSTGFTGKEEDIVLEEVV